MAAVDQETLVAVVASKRSEKVRFLSETKNAHFFYWQKFGILVDRCA